MEESTVESFKKKKKKEKLNKHATCDVERIIEIDGRSVYLV